MWLCLLPVHQKEAEKIANRLVRLKLSACVNIVSGIHSTYWWQGKIENSSEILLIIKTKRILTRKLIACVKKVHSYTVPEIIALPIAQGNKDYLNWIDESVIPHPNPLPIWERIEGEGRYMEEM